MSIAAVLFIKLYQRLISPFFSGSCRFYPSCSDYSIEAIQVHGIFHGLLLSGLRILRCNPFCSGGFDPVPNSKECSHSHNLKTLK